MLPCLVFILSGPWGLNSGLDVVGKPRKRSRLDRVFLCLAELGMREAERVFGFRLVFEWMKMED